MRLCVIVSVLCFAVFDVLQATKSAYSTKVSPAGQPLSGFSCLAGRPGIPGRHGNPGAPGRDGRDGREGIQGQRGPRGFNGTPGQKGAPGSPGSTGKSGPQGPEGTKGDAGPKGDKGEPGSNGLSCLSNWKECSWNAFGESKDNGLIKDCVFQKKYSETYLHVYWNGNFRIYDCNACCKRWFFTFNGTECQAPRAIDGILYMRVGKNTQDIHRVRHIEGHCDKIHKGHVRVGFNVGNCAGFGDADAHTGDASTSRLFIEEVPRPQP